LDSVDTVLLLESHGTLGQKSNSTYIKSLLLCLLIKTQFYKTYFSLVTAITVWYFYLILVTWLFWLLFHYCKQSWCQSNHFSC